MNFSKQARDYINLLMARNDIEIRRLQLDLISTGNELGAKAYLSGEELTGGGSFADGYNWMKEVYENPN